MTIPEKGPPCRHGFSRFKPNIDEREIQKVTRLLFGKKSSWHNFRHILPQSIQTSANNLACLKRLHEQNKALNKSPGIKAPGGGYSPILPIRGRAAGQGMVFGLSVLNRVKILTESVLNRVSTCRKRGMVRTDCRR